MKSDGHSPHRRRRKKPKLEKKKKNSLFQAQGKLHAQWASLAAAKPNSFKGVMHRLSQAVLEREDPDAAFLRSLPPHSDGKPEGDEQQAERQGEAAVAPAPLHFTLHHPSTEPERLVRRRTRLLVRKGRADATRRLWGWGLFSVPLLPVLLTPLPALPLYYSIWKAYTARAALRGSRGLAEALDALAEEQSARATAAVAAKAAAASVFGGGEEARGAEGGRGGGSGEGSGSSSGPVLLLRSASLPPRGSWADAALAAGPKPAPGEYLDIFGEGQRRSVGSEEREEKSPPPLAPLRPRISFVALSDLDSAVASPSSSSSSSLFSSSASAPLLSLEAAEALERKLNAPGLREGVQRVLRRARKEVEEEASRRKEAGGGGGATEAAAAAHAAASAPPPRSPSPVS